MWRLGNCSRPLQRFAEPQRGNAMDGETLRLGIFALRTRRFGSVAECMVKRLRKYGKAKNLFHDLFDKQTGQRIEVKFSTVQQKAKRTVTDETVLNCIEDAIAEREPVLFSGWQNNSFDCNIQQVKRPEFDVHTTGCFSRIAWRSSESLALTSEHEQKAETSATRTSSIKA